MPTWLRSILAVVGGLAAAFVVVLIFDFISSLVVPLPAGFDMTNPEAMADFVRNLPPTAYVILIAGWLVASLAAGWVSARIANRSLVHGLVTAGLFLIIGIVNLLSLPHPVWVWVVGIAAYLIGGYFGAQLASKGKVPAPAAA